MEPKRIAAMVIAAAGVIGAIWLIWPEKARPDEELIRESIAQMALAAQNKDLPALMEHVSEGYRGEGGDRTELKRYLLAYILRSDWVTAVPANVEVKLEGTDATVSLVVLLARSRATKAEEIPAEGLAGSHQIEAVYRKEGDTWRVVNAKRRDATPADWLR